MKWTDKDIVEWHKKTFPNCTIEEQAQKVKEEIQEVINTLINADGTDRYIEECLMIVPTYEELKDDKSC